MKTLYVIAGILAIAALPLAAQQVPLVTGFGFQTQLANPAEKGTHDSPVSVLYRHQWVSFGDDSPITFLLDADLSSALGLKDKRAGVGFRLVRDNAHIVKRTQINLDFSYHLISTGSLMLSAGVSGGVLNQRMDFAETRVNDPGDLTLFAASESKMRFDGGPSVFLRLGRPSASHLKAGASLPQLFTSDLDYDQGRIFGIQPQLQGYASYLIYGESVSIEPVVFTRMMMGDFDCNCTNIDLLLRAHFMENRFWAGGGYRLNGGFMGGFGVKVLDDRLQINGIAETLTNFGLSYEVGLTYALIEGKKTMPVQLKSKLGQDGRNSDVIKRQIASVVRSFEGKLTAASTELNEAKNKRDRKSQAKGHVQKAKELLGQAEEDLKILQASVNQLEEIERAATNAEKEYEEYKNKDIKKIQSNYKAVAQTYQNQQRNLQTLKYDLDNFITSNRLDEVNIVRDDAESVREFFQGRLDQLAQKPADTRPVEVESRGGQPIEIKYHFPFEELSYNVTRDNSLSEVKNLADHIADAVQEIRNRGHEVISVTVTGNLQSAMSDLNFESEIRYAGELASGNSLSLNYAFKDMNAGGREVTRKKTLSTTSKKALDFEELPALQMYALKDYLNRKIADLPKDRVNYELQGPVGANEYFLETSITIKVKR